MRQVKLRSLPLSQCKYKQVYVINQIYFDFSSTEKSRRLSAVSPLRPPGFRPLRSRRLSAVPGGRSDATTERHPMEQSGIGMSPGGPPHSGEGEEEKKENPSAFRDSAPFGRAIPPRLRRGLQTVIKKAQSSKLVALFCFRFAEAEGFEPPERCRSTVFKTAAIDHSATPPDINRISCPYLSSSLPEGRTYAGRKSNKRRRR